MDKASPEELSQQISTLKIKEEEMKDVIKRAQSGCLNVNQSIREQIERQQVVLDRVIQDMEEQRDNISAQVEN